MNYLLGSSQLYPTDVGSYAKNRFETLSEKTFQITFGSPTNHYFSDEHCIKHLPMDIDGNTRHLTDVQHSNYNEVGYAICMGVGLGHHRPHLQKNFNFNELVIIEPNFELFYQSMHCFDWINLIRSLEGNDATLSFYLGGEVTV